MGRGECSAVENYARRGACPPLARRGRGRIRGASSPYQATTPAFHTLVCRPLPALAIAAPLRTSSWRSSTTTTVLKVEAVPQYEAAISIGLDKKKNVETLTWLASSLYRAGRPRGGDDLRTRVRQLPPVPARELFIDCRTSA